MAKVLFPRNIKKGMFSMSISVGPLTVSIVQLFLLAIGVASGLGVFNYVSGSAGRVAGILAALPVVLLFVVIVFFKISEMNLLAFLAKVVRSYFFDSNRKFQTRYERQHTPIELAIARARAIEAKDIIEAKDSVMSVDDLKKIQSSGLL